MAQTAGEPARDRRGMTLFLLCLAAIMATGLPLPFGLGAFAFLIPGFVLAVKMITKPGPTPRLIIAMSIGLIAVLAGMSLVRVIFYPAQLEYQRCMQAAITEVGQHQCERELRDRLAEYGLPTTRPS